MHRAELNMVRNKRAATAQQGNEMTTSGLLSLGISEVVQPKTGESLGFVFVEASAEGLLERWLFFRHPHNEFELRAPPASMGRWTLDDWQKFVREEWRSEGYYVWAEAISYRYGQTYGGTAWTVIPPAPQLPRPVYPEIPGTDFQLDYLESTVVELAQRDWYGRGYVVGSLSDKSSIEYWLLPAQYVPVTEVSAAITPSKQGAGSLAEFVEMSNQNWHEGAQFVVTGCINYHGEKPPRYP